MSAPKATARKSAFLAGLAFLLVGAAGLFFLLALRRNWTRIAAFHPVIEPLAILLAFLAIAADYLLTTAGWHITMRSLSRLDVPFPVSVAAVNASRLAKYLPGNGWSTAFQMYWLQEKGYAKSLTLFTGLLNYFLSQVAYLIGGLALAVFSRRPAPSALVFALASTAAAELLVVLTFPWTSRKAIATLNRVFRLEIAALETSRGLLCRLHGIYFLAAFSFGSAAVLTCQGIGVPVDRDTAFLVISSAIVAEVLGCAAIFTMGGLGVREAGLYLMLGAAPGALPLILPLALRLLSMSADIVFGWAGFHFLKRLSQPTAPRQKAPAVSGGGS